MKWTILWNVLAVLCLLYSIAILFTGSGSNFWLFWVAAGGFCAVFSFLARTGGWGRLPFALRTGLLLAVAAVGILFFIVEFQILRLFGSEPEANADYLIVLGAQVTEGGPSLSLQYRLESAARYLEQNPDTLCVVSGGQGPNEPCSEAAAMRDYLLSCGIRPDRIYTEEASTSTTENLAFTLSLTGPDGNALIDPSKDHVVIVTNNYHMFRSCAIARKAGFVHVSGLSAKSPITYIPNNLVREFCGVLKDYLMKNL